MKKIFFFVVLITCSLGSTLRPSPSTPLGTGSGQASPLEAKIVWKGTSQERLKKGFPKTFVEAPLCFGLGSYFFKLSIDSFWPSDPDALGMLFSFSTFTGSLFCFFEGLRRGVIGAGLMSGYDVEKQPESLKEVSKNNYEAPPEDVEVQGNTHADEKKNFRTKLSMFKTMFKKRFRRGRQ